MSFAPGFTESPYLNPDFYFPTDEDQFREVLYNREYDTANILNIKEIATYDLIEIVTGQQWFTATDPQTKRQTFRTVVNFGALPNAGTKAVPHGIANIGSPDFNFAFTKIYGCATNPAAVDPAPYSIPLPYASATGNNVELYVTTLNVVVITTVNLSAFTTCTIVLEYLKN